MSRSEAAIASSARSELLEQILGARPPGHFDGARGLLELFVDTQVELTALWQRLHRTRVGTPRSTALTVEVCAKSETLFELARVLRLLPGDRGRPRLQ